MATVTDLLAALGELDLLPEVPPDVPALLRLVPRADLSVQDEVQIALHPTLTRVWSPKGHAGQRLVRAPGSNQKCYGFGQVDWRDGDLCFGFSPRRNAGAANSSGEGGSALIPQSCPAARPRQLGPTAFAPGCGLLLVGLVLAVGRVLL